ncbi:fasciclin domain-containing protein [Lutibacter sp.]|uniref:fasciclin domain-containing protein n=1 Tax=Lutibacter sp. TaxID=1925666 RepID=UPI001A2261C4|nr:fasciclin domain-containing protein [Lutibacter sp.]MBI9042766.1 fasciclin domain-containing protein [Lutibacter sp.]
MKNFKYISVLILAVSFVFTSCNDDDDTMEVILPTQNIVEIAQANGFTSLAAALTKANLVDALQTSGKFTVFAPTNEAFDNLLAAIGQTSIDDVPASVLEKILLYHVVQGEVMSGDVTAGNVPTLAGENIALTTAGGIKVNSASVIMPYDVAATNGVIHTINEVLVPPTIAPFVNSVLEPAYFSENFTTLIAAAAKANLVDALLNTPNLTIFAPTNDAFAASGLDLNALSAEAIANVLTYHVVGAKVLSSGIPRDAATLNGAKLWFSLVSSGNFINGDTQIVAVDIESGSGVVHVINKVLLPPTGNLVETAVALSASGEFTSLVAALTRTAIEGTAAQNLITVLSGNGPFTVFAPTNAAFQALLDSNPAWNGLGDIPLETLIAVLTYHVVPAKAFDKDVAGALDANNMLPTANGAKLTFDVANFKINTNTSIIGVNTNASNGVIHVIDKVLLP